MAQDKTLSSEERSRLSSEEYRAECEARYVLNMATRADRARFIQAVSERRSQAAANKLRADIIRMMPSHLREATLNALTRSMEIREANLLRDMTQELISREV